MRKISYFTNIVILSGIMVIMAWETGFALPGPPDPPPAPVGNLYAQFAVVGGIVAYGAYYLWRANRAVKKDEKEQ